MTKEPWDLSQDWVTLEQTAAIFLTTVQVVKNTLYEHPELFPKPWRYTKRGDNRRRLLSKQRDLPILAQFFQQYVKHNPS